MRLKSAMTLSPSHFRLASFTVIATIIIGVGLNSNWFDGAGEDNTDRDAQRLIFCLGRCLTGTNAVNKPCTHVDVAPPKSFLIHGPDLCKDKKWKDPLININELKKKLPGYDDDKENETKA